MIWTGVTKGGGECGDTSSHFSERQIIKCSKIAFYKYLL